MAERDRLPKPAPGAPPKLAKDYGKMIDIPGGTFKMGSDDGDADEKPVHDEKVASFKLDEVEVTVEAYAKCVDDRKCEHPGSASAACNFWVAGRGKHPVNCVGLADATAFCKAVGKRLPTEVEWEYAARGGERALKYPWGGAEPGNRACWDGIAKTQPHGATHKAG